MSNLDRSFVSFEQIKSRYLAKLNSNYALAETFLFCFYRCEYKNVFIKLMPFQHEKKSIKNISI